MGGRPADRALEAPDEIFLTPRVLLDTHVLVRWLLEPKRLSREQSRILRQAARRLEPVAVSAITLLEIAVLSGTGRLKPGSLFHELETNPVFRILPLTIEIAQEVANLTSVLRDPSDCVIASTARVHGLRLLTSDRRIIDSNLVSTVE